jgi:hypothetical protein
MNIYWCRATEPMNSPGHISELRYPAPITLIKHLDVKDFLGEMAYRCTPVTNEMKNTIVIKAPIDISINILPDGNWDIQGQSNEFVQHFFGAPQGKRGLHQLAFSYYFFAEQSLEATQLPAYYDLNSFTRNTRVLSATFDIGKWFHLWKPTFLINNDARQLIIKEGDPLIYIRFNTNDKINLIEFDDAEMRLMAEKHPSWICSTLTKNTFGVVPLKKLYDYFVNANMQKRVLKIIKRNIVE